MRLVRETSSSEDNHHREANGQHWKCEQLASREGSQIESDMRIGFPHELDHEPEHAIKAYQSPGDRSRSEILPEYPLNDQEQNHAFQQRFVELRGVSDDVSAGRKNHSPGKGCLSAVELAVDEVADAHEKEAYRCGRTHEV